MISKCAQALPAWQTGPLAAFWHALPLCTMPCLGSLAQLQHVSSMTNPSDWDKVDQQLAADRLNFLHNTAALTQLEGLVMATGQAFTPQNFIQHDSL